MFVHNVYFWLKGNLSNDDKARFISGLQDLVDIDAVAHGYFGTPAPTDRPVIDRTYDYGLTVVLADQEAHDAYQEHPDHDRFRKHCADLWTEVKIYDFVTP